ncbi:hypothetical protein ACHAXS_010213 [Conticribra weissflogii]
MSTATNVRNGGGDAVLDLISSFLHGPADLSSECSKDDTAANASNHLFNSPLDRSGPHSTGKDSDDSKTTGFFFPRKFTSLARIIIFSKDRPWQLQQLLKSMRLQDICLKENVRDMRIFPSKVEVFIIYCASSPPFSRGYDKVVQQFSKKKLREIHFVNENEWQTSHGGIAESNAFSEILECVITRGDDHSTKSANVSLGKNNGSSNNHIDDGVVMFLTDDCLFLEPLEVVLSAAIGALSYGLSTVIDEGRLIANPKISNGTAVFNFLNRLHAGISWSQTRDVASPAPRNQMKFLPLKPYFCNLEESSNKINPNLADGVYLYERKFGYVEWDYPFDLSGGVYRHEDVVALLTHIKGKDCEENEQSRRTKQNGLGHPNTFELRCNTSLATSFKPSLLNTSAPKIGKSVTSVELEKTMTAIPCHPYMVILALNSVQDVFNAPIASSGDCRIGVEFEKGHAEISNSVCNDNRDPLNLLQYLEKGYDLDLDRYKATAYNASQIGDLFIRQRSHSKLSGEAIHQSDRSKLELDFTSVNPNISVLMPVHKGPPHAAILSMTSLIMQSIDERERVHSHPNGEVENNLLSSMQIVIIDDRCADGSIDAMIDSAKEFMSTHKDIHLVLNDFRKEDALQEDHCSDHPSTSKMISIAIEVVSSPCQGIATALNYGLQICRADLVARMDADDVCARSRLISQIRFMLANPSFAVVGSSAVLFSNDCEKDIFPYYISTSTSGRSNSTDSMNNPMRCSLSISDPGFMAWTMFFSCSIPHPSVVFRKRAISNIGGYKECINHCEDYDLWLRLTQNDCRSMMCLPRVGVWHRKHSQSESSNNSLAQKKESDLVCFEAVKNLIRGESKELRLDTVSILRNPSFTSMKSPEDVDLAAELLLLMERMFVENNSEHLKRQEIDLIKIDCDERIGELATVQISKFGSRIGENSIVWRAWTKRCPHQHLERLSLLCHKS